MLTRVEELCAVEDSCAALAMLGVVEFPETQDITVAVSVNFWRAGEQDRLQTEADNAQGKQRDAQAGLLAMQDEQEQEDQQRLSVQRQESEESEERLLVPLEA